MRKRLPTAHLSTCLLPTADLPRKLLPNLLDESSQVHRTKQEPLEAAPVEAARHA